MGTDYFKYFLSEKDEFLVVSLVGDMRVDALPKLKQCLEEVKARKFKFMIFNFHDVRTIDRDGITSLSHLQKAVRDKPATLRLCFIKPHIKDRLLMEGIVREVELVDSLLLALQSFKPT